LIEKDWKGFKERRQTNLIVRIKCLSAKIFQMQYKTKEDRDVKVWIDQIERERHSKQEIDKKKEKKRERERQK